AIATVRRDTIFTNVVMSKGKTVWWEGGDGDPPAEGWDWRGRPWSPGMKDENGKPVVGAHPNARFTTPISQCPSHTFRLDHHHGVPISAIIFGGRRARLAPLVYQSFSWQHGVYVGATMASERTAAAMGAVGEVRRDPMAMLPFCGYNMADYFRHWLQVGQAMTRPPKVFHVNWFRTDENGEFLWPGYGDNLRVLEWILARCRGEVDAIATPIGHIPTAGSLDMTGLDLSDSVMQELLRVDRTEWLKETDDVQSYFSTFGDRMPHALRDEADSLRRRLAM
ncbi:MAG: phosphoenolpyruvate carboxykinase (GTP), partial [Phycisphaerae bacterium]|nr:phosphoenolpyruvate carboxykinase (GTP) [Phycisphaerae bacterium]